MATPEEQAATMMANLPERTGKPLDEWLRLIAGTSLEKHGQIVAFLKSEHGVTHGFANAIAAKALERAAPVDPVAAQYAGAKAALKPIYDAVMAHALSLGDDVTVAPKKDSVSLRRQKQFALITPATRTRIDLGLALKGVAPSGRLEAGNAMCSHRVRLSQPVDVDDEVRGWMAAAYARSG